MRKQRGFTYIELMFVMAFIGILAAMLLPALARTREAARRSSCMNNLAQLGIALHLYAGEHDQRLPWWRHGTPGEALTALYPDYVDSYNLFQCPSYWGFYIEKKDGSIDFSEVPMNTYLRAQNSMRASYDYFGAYTEAPIRLPGPTRAIPKIAIMWDVNFGMVRHPNPTEDANAEHPFIQQLGNGNHVPSGSNVLWLDGSVEFIQYEVFAERNFPARPRHFETPYRSPAELSYPDPNDEVYQSIYYPNLNLGPTETTGLIGGSLEGWMPKAPPS